MARCGRISAVSISFPFVPLFARMCGTYRPALRALRRYASHPDVAARITMLG